MALSLVVEGLDRCDMLTCCLVALPQVFLPTRRFLYITKTTNVLLYFVCLLEVWLLVPTLDFQDSQ
jgi:hypothetical protein